MPDTQRDFCDWTNPATGERRRMVRTPRKATHVEPDGTITNGSLAWTSAPAFGAAGNSTWRRLPQGTIYDVMIPQYGYDKLPLGWFDPPTLAFKVKTLGLEEEGMTDLIESLADPLYDAPNKELVANRSVLESYGVPGLGLSAVGGTWRAVDTSDVWHLLSDDGDPDLEIGDFRVLFIGGHEVSVGSVHDAHTVTGEATIDVKLVHLLWLVMAGVQAEDLRTAVEFTVTPTAAHLLLYDVVWFSASAGVGYARTLGSRSGDSDPDEHFMYTLLQITDALFIVLTNVLRCWTRTTATLVDAGNRLGYGKLVMREQSQTVANTAGATNADYLVCGFRKGAVSGDHRGGWLSDLGGEEGTVYELKTMDRLLIDPTEGCAQKSGVRNVAVDSIAVDITGITESLAALTILPTAQTWTGRRIEIGVEGLSGADVEIPGSQDGDQQSIKIRREGVRDHNNRTVPVVLHNQPHIGPIANMGFESRTFGGEQYLCLTSALVTMNCLYYMGELKGEGGAGSGVFVPIRYHHKVGVTDGATTYDECTDGIALPDPGAGIVWNYESTLIDPLRLAMIQMQTEGCIPFAVARRIVNRFPPRTQAIYPGTVPALHVPTDALGNRADSGDWASGQDLTGKAYHASVPGEPILIATSLDEASGTADVRLFGMGGF